MATSAGKILIMPKGAWSASETYGYLDLVSYNGSKWLCKVESCTNVEPTSAATVYWYAWDDSNVGGSAVDFNEPAVRSVLQSGDTVSTLFGKTKKYFSDMKDVAFSGDFADLNNVPDASTTTKGVVKVDGTTIKINSDGVISGAGGDAKDVDYDNQKSKLLATNVQNAIDELVTKDGVKGDALTYDSDDGTLSLRSGGTSGTVLSSVTIEGGASSIINVNTTESAWKGSTTALVTITNGTETFTGNFDASGKFSHKIKYVGIYTVSVKDSSGTYSSSVNAVSVGGVYNVTIDKEITLNLTVYSASSDSVNIYYGGVKKATADAVCVTNTSGTGTVTVTVPKNANVMFESTIAKDTTSGTSNYTKNVTLSDSTNEIKLMPEGKILYWYGYKTVDFSANTYTQNGWHNVGWGRSTPSFNPSTNELVVSNPSYQGTGSVFSSAFNVENYTKLKTIQKSCTYLGVGMHVMGGLTNSYADAFAWTTKNGGFSFSDIQNAGKHIGERELNTTPNTNQYFVVNFSMHSSTPTLYLDAVWLEK